MTRNRQDIAVGVIFVAIGLLFGFDVWRTELEVGTPLRMGPGFFPVILASVLVVLGAVIAVRGAISRISPEAFRAIPWRGLLFIAPLPVIFGLTIEARTLRRNMPPLSPRGFRMTRARASLDAARHRFRGSTTSPTRFESVGHGHVRLRIASARHSLSPRAACRSR